MVLKHAYDLLTKAFGVQLPMWASSSVRRYTVLMRDYIGHVNVSSVTSQVQSVPDCGLQMGLTLVAVKCLP